MIEKELARHGRRGSWEVVCLKLGAKRQKPQEKEEWLSREEECLYFKQCLGPVWEFIYMNMHATKYQVMCRTIHTSLWYTHKIKITNYSTNMSFPLFAQQSQMDKTDICMGKLTLVVDTQHYTRKHIIHEQ